MEEYKFIVDILSSSASLVAIIVVLLGLYKSIQKPLKIERVVIQKGKSSSTYILVVKNRKPYPVEIKSINCYMRRFYSIERKNNQKPEYSALLSLSDSPFQSSKLFNIAANGHTDIQIKNGLNINGDVKKLLFSAHTSHGYHEMWCKNIVTISTGTQVYGLEYRHEYESKIKSILVYYWLRFKVIIK